MLNIKPEFWTKSDGKRFVVLTLRDFEKVQEAIEDAGLAKILRQAKQGGAGEPGISLAEMKRRLGIAPRTGMVRDLCLNGFNDYVKKIRN